METAERAEHVRLPGDAPSARAARRFVRDVLERWQLDSVVEPALLGVSELVTNALLHAGGEIEVGVEHRTDSVRVSVRDTARLPALGARTMLAASGEPAAGVDDGTTGRGLLIVLAIATAVGETFDDFGKRVWFELPLDPAAARGTGLVVQQGVGDHAPRPAARVVRLRAVPTVVVVATDGHLQTLAREARLHRGPTASRFVGALSRLWADYPSFPDAVERARVAWSRGVERVDLDLRVDDDVTGCLDEVRSALTELESLVAAGGMLSLAPAPDVERFRRWLVEEIERQLDGRDPAPYPVS